MFTYKIKNTFHGTEATFKMDGAFETSGQAYDELVYQDYSLHKGSDEYKKAHRKLQRVNNKLCGSKSCQCSGMIRSNDN